MSKQFELMAKIIDNFEKLKYTLLEAQTFDPDHYGFPDIYYDIMETDEVRVGAFKDAFKLYNNLKGKVVCEAGVGTLALTKLYLPYVKKAYLIESNPNVRKVIKRILKKNKWEHKVELIFDDALKVKLPQKVDFVIGELMSIYCGNELQVQIFKHLRQFLKPNGKLIPGKILNMVQLGKAKFDRPHNHYPLLFTRHWPTLVSSTELINTINLYTEEELRVRRKIPIRIHMDEEINCVFMNSWIDLAPGINFTGTDSLMPPTVKKLVKPVSVKAGQIVHLECDFTYGTSLAKAKFRVV